MINSTRYAAQAVPLMAPDGKPVVVAIVKATYRIADDGKPVLAEKQQPVRMSDEPYDPDNPWSSLRYPSDLCPGKVGTDVVVVGEAIADPPAKVVDVAVSARDVTATLRVHGPRVYFKHVVGVAVGPAATFERVPITYELAYGGATDDSARVERRNPAGRGVAKNVEDLVDTPAPQIEHPSHPIKSASDRPEPVGFGAIPSHWLPRADLAGTFDETWMSERMPILPSDFDWRHYNCAHPSLIVEPHLKAGDRIGSKGLTKPDTLICELPDMRLVLEARYDHGERQLARPPVDTVIFVPAQRRLELVARHAFDKGRGAMALREIRAQLADGG